MNANPNIGMIRNWVSGNDNPFTNKSGNGAAKDTGIIIPHKTRPANAMFRKILLTLMIFALF